MTPLVLLHAFPLDSSMYDAVRNRLASRSTLVTPDLPGFGAAPLSSDSPGLDVYADAVAAELDQRRLDRVVIGGTSMGGYVSMAFARRYPDRVAGLALIDTRASGDTPPAAEGRRAMAVVLETTPGVAPLLDGVFPKLLGATSFSERPDIVELVRTIVTRCDPRAAAWAQRAMADRPDSFDTLQSFIGPTVVVVGAEDVLTPPPDAAAMAEVLGQGAAVVVVAAGHLTPIEAPEAVTEALTSLMDRVDASV